MLYSNYTKQRNGETWEKNRKQTNLVNKLKKKNNFLERCCGGAKSCDFWKTMKPFL
jgi:hypothetical protein